MVFSGKIFHIWLVDFRKPRVRESFIQCHSLDWILDQQLDYKISSLAGIGFPILLIEFNGIIQS